MSQITETTSAVSKEEELYGSARCHFDEYFCEITRQMDEYNEYYKTESDQEWRRAMRVYMCSPDCNNSEWYIAIRVPGATRGHLKVEPHNGFWKVVDIKFYSETAIIGVSNIGCFRPEIQDHVSEWIGTIIDFGEHNPKI